MTQTLPNKHPNFIRDFSYEILGFTRECLILELKPSGTRVLLGIPAAQRENPGAVLHVEVILEDWIQRLPTVLQVLEDPGEDEVYLVGPHEEVQNVVSVRVGKLVSPGNPETMPWQFSFRAAQWTDLRRVRLQITLWGPKVLVQYTHFEQGVRIGGKCYLDAALPELPQLCKQLDQMGVPYAIQAC